MIAIVIVGLLAMVALPTYNNSIRKGRRAEAVSALAAIQQAQERYRANNTQYCCSPLTNALLPSTSGLNLPSTSSTGLYSLSVEYADLSSYVITAQAVSGTSQANDTSCTTMRLQLFTGAVSYGGCNSCAAVAPSATSLSDPNRCWAH